MGVLADQLNAGRAALLEQPEDLGAVTAGAWSLHRPASLWQLPEIAQLLELPNVHTAALFMTDFGSNCAMPTRFLGRFPRLETEPRFHHGLPSFRDTGEYAGPLPQPPQVTERQPRGVAPRPRPPKEGKAASPFWPQQLTTWVAGSLVEECTSPSALREGVGAQTVAPAHTRERGRTLRVPPVRGPPVDGNPLGSCEVYIGRGCRWLPPSSWGNPFSARTLGREEAARRFAEHLRSHLGLLADLRALDGAVLRCHCPIGIALPRRRYHCAVDCKHGEPWTPRFGRGLSAAASCGQGSTKDLRTAFGCPRLPRRRGAYFSWSLGPREPHPCRLGGPLLRPQGGAARVPWRRVRGGPQGVRAGSREHGCSSEPGGAVRPFRRGGALRRAGRPECLAGRAGARR